MYSCITGYVRKRYDHGALVLAPSVLAHKYKEELWFFFVVPPTLICDFYLPYFFANKVYFTCMTPGLNDKFPNHRINIFYFSGYKSCTQNKNFINLAQLNISKIAFWQGWNYWRIQATYKSNVICHFSLSKTCQMLPG